MLWTMAKVWSPSEDRVTVGTWGALTVGVGGAAVGVGGFAVGVSRAMCTVGIAEGVLPTVGIAEGGCLSGVGVLTVTTAALGLGVRLKSQRPPPMYSTASSAAPRAIHLALLVLVVGVLVPCFILDTWMLDGFIIAQGTHADKTAGRRCQVPGAQRFSLGSHLWYNTGLLLADDVGTGHLCATGLGGRASGARTRSITAILFKK